MNKKYAIIGLLILMVLGLGCIGNNSTNTPATKSDISSRLATSEKSGIFSDTMKTINGCANKYSATFNNGDYLEIQWDNHNSPCENNLSYIYYSIDYISGNDSYKLSYNSGVKENNSYFTDFSKDVIKRYNSGELSNQDKEIYADFNNVSDIGKFVVKISGTDGTRFTGTINGMVDSYSPIKQIDDTIPREFSVDNLKSLSLKRETIGLMRVEVLRDDKLIFSNYASNRDKTSLEYSSNPGYLKEDMPAD